MHTNGNIAYKLITGLEYKGITKFESWAVAPDFFYGYNNFHVNLSPLRKSVWQHYTVIRPILQDYPAGHEFNFIGPENMLDYSFKTKISSVNFMKINLRFIDLNI